MFYDSENENSDSDDEWSGIDEIPFWPAGRSEIYVIKQLDTSTVPKWESFMTIPESTSIVLNLNCQQYKRAVIQRLTLWYSLLALNLM